MAGNCRDELWQTFKKQWLHTHSHSSSYLASLGSYASSHQSHLSLTQRGARINTCPVVPSATISQSVSSQRDSHE